MHAVYTWVSVCPCQYLVLVLFPLVLRQGFSLNLKLSLWWKLTGQWILLGLLDSAASHHHSSSVMMLNAHAWLFMWVIGKPSSGPPTFAAHTLPTEPSPKSQTSMSLYSNQLILLILCVSMWATWYRTHVAVKGQLCGISSHLLASVHSSVHLSFPLVFFKGNPVGFANT